MARNSFKISNFKTRRINTCVFFHRKFFGFNTYVKTPGAGEGEYLPGYPPRAPSLYFRTPFG
jgi:hypothetical protein